MYKEEKKQKVPFGISFIAKLSIIGAVIGLISFMVAIFFDNFYLLFLVFISIPIIMSLGIIVNPLLPFYFEISTDLLVMEILIVGAGQLGLGIGMLKAKLWSWILGIFFLVTFIVLNMIGLLESLSYPIDNYLYVLVMILVTIVAPLISLMYLFKPSVRKYFQKPISDIPV